MKFMSNGNVNTYAVCSIMLLLTFYFSSCDQNRIFEDNIDDAFARQQVNNLLRDLTLPEGADPDVQPPTGPTGEIFR